MLRGILAVAVLALGAATAGCEDPEPTQETAVSPTVQEPYTDAEASAEFARLGLTDNDIAVLKPSLEAICAEASSDDTPMTALAMGRISGEIAFMTFEAIGAGIRWRCADDIEVVLEAATLWDEVRTGQHPNCAKPYGHEDQYPQHALWSECPQR